MDVFINEQRVMTAKNSIRIDKTIDERGTASFVVVDPDAQLDIKRGQDVVIYHDGQRIWGGVVERCSDQFAWDSEYNNPGLIHNVSCVSYAYYADKRIVAATYQEQSVAAIVHDLYNRFLHDEGIDLGDVSGDDVISEVRFNYIPVSRALTVLAERSSSWWMIDEYKRLHFLPLEMLKSDFVLDKRAFLKGSLRVEAGNSLYRNRQYVLGGRDTTDWQTETVVGDGETRSWTVGYPLADVQPEITVDGTPQTVSVKGSGEDTDFFWAVGESVITHNSRRTPITGSIQIKYRGTYPIVLIYPDQEQIAERQQIEGGTGYVERVDEEETINSLAAATEFAISRLKRYGTVGRRVTFATHLPVPDPGRVITAAIPEHRLYNTELLVESVSISQMGSDVIYDVVAVSGASHQSWIRFFVDLYSRMRQANIAENISEGEYVTLIESFSKIWDEEEHPNIFHKLYPSDTTFPGPDTYLMFGRRTEVKYIAWFINGVEAGRRQVTRFDYKEDGREISTTFALLPGEAVGNITHLAWYGGIKATEELGSGIEIDRVEFEHTKTPFEQINVMRMDIKGW